MKIITDDFGNAWEKCDLDDCGLHICRPGYAKCDNENCPDKVGNEDGPNLYRSEERKSSKHS